ncbi:hypothetical protein [Halomonas sp. SpR8]|nr:hypothetical protein [Halomonas sp. SpR8]MDQ7728525.1 hypothetical protein [Halomonas sp. SpR8]
MSIELHATAGREMGGTIAPPAWLLRTLSFALQNNGGGIAADGHRFGYMP